MKTPIICDTCSGEGVVKPKNTSSLFNSPILIECSDCDGKGYIAIPAWFFDTTTKKLEILALEVEELKTIAENATEMVEYWKARYVSTQADLTAIIKTVNTALTEETLPDPNG